MCCLDFCLKISEINKTYLLKGGSLPPGGLNRVVCALGMSYLMLRYNWKQGVAVFGLLSQTSAFVAFLAGAIELGGNSMAGAH